MIIYKEIKHHGKIDPRKVQLQNEEFFTMPYNGYDELTGFKVTYMLLLRFGGNYKKNKLTFLTYKIGWDT